VVDKLVTDIVERVFPEGTEIQLGGKTDPKSSRFWIVPDRQNEPRWILPYKQKYADTFLQQWSPYDLSSRLKWCCLMSAYKRKLLGWVPGIVPLHIHVPQWSQWGHLGWSLPRPPVPVIYVRNPGPKRKVVMGLVDSQTNKVISVCKSPLDPNGKVAINHEAEVLIQMESEKPDRAPRNLFLDRLKGISSQEFVDGISTGRQLNEGHVAYLANLVISEEILSLREVAEKMNEQIEDLKIIAPESRSLLDRVITEADDPLLIPKVWEHGDFTPWNIKIVEEGILRAFDWENASRKGLPLFDFIFFHSVQKFFFGVKTLFPKGMACHLESYMDKLRIPRAKAKKIIQVCLVRDWLRCQKTGDWFGCQNQGNQSKADFLMDMLAALPGEMP